jgi:hypothetical protein
VSKAVVHVTLAVKRQRNYPHYCVRMVGPRSGAQTGEFEIPLRLEFDCAWLDQRSQLVRINLPDAPQPTATVLEPSNG